MNYRQSCSMDSWKKSDDFPVAMAYVPWQKWGKTYEADKALCQGTVFPELDKPFGCWKGGRK